MRTPAAIELGKGNFSARSLDLNDVGEMEKAYAFRHKVFCEELSWQSKDGRECDEYDQTSIHFGVFSNSGEILGYSRLHLPQGPFMVEDEFADLVASGYKVRKEADTVEATRFAVARDLRRTKEGFQATELLCRTMCMWARRNGMRYWYMVLDKDYLDFIQRFFPIEEIGKPKEYEPGVSSIAVMVDLFKLGTKQSDIFWNTLGDESRAG